MKTLSLILAAIAGIATGQLLNQKFNKPNTEVSSTPIQFTGEKPDVQTLPPVGDMLVSIVKYDGNTYIFVAKNGVGAICKK